MTTHSPYASDAEIEAIGEGFLARTLEKPRWTHAAHFAATAFLILRRPDIVPERDMPELIRSYNLSVGARTPTPPAITRPSPRPPSPPPGISWPRCRRGYLWPKP